MKWALTGTVAITVVASVAASACGRTEATATRDAARDSAVVAGLVHERLRAAQAGDTARWHRFVSDSCVWVGAGLRAASTREVLPSIAANRAIRLAAQQIRDLVVYVSRDVAQATYVQQVQDAGQASEAGKRFRKLDTFVRRDSTWLLIGASEVAVPFRARVALGAEAAERLVGRYALADVDTLAVNAVPAGRLTMFTMRGRDGTVDTLLAESDSVLFVEGDHGSWVFAGATRGAARALLYRSAGAADVTLSRVVP